MTQVIAKYAAKKLLASELEKHKKREPSGSYDPYYTYIQDPRTKKRKKAKKLIPDYIPEHDAKILAKVRKRAYWLDCSLFNIMGFRFGWSSVIGIIPAVGDAIDALMAAMLVRSCAKVKCDLGNFVIFQMLFNIALDFVVGLVPFIGDLADASFKANSKNVRLLEKRLDEAYMPANLKKDLEQEAKKYGDDYQPPPPASVLEEIDEDDPREKLPMHRQDVEPRRPEPARVPTETRGGEKSNTRKGTIQKNDSRREKRRGQ